MPLLLLATKRPILAPQRTTQPTLAVVTSQPTLAPATTQPIFVAPATTQPTVVALAVQPKLAVATTQPMLALAARLSPSLCLYRARHSCHPPWLHLFLLLSRHL